MKKTNSNKAALVAITALFTVFNAEIAKSEAWMQLGGVSHHFEEQSYEFNENNSGIGLLFEVAKYTISLGKYLNSVEKVSPIWSNYLILGRNWITYKNHHLYDSQISLGTLVGAVDGYKINDGHPLPFGAFQASYTNKWVGVDLVYVPKVIKSASSVLSLQFRISLKGV